MRGFRRTVLILIVLVSIFWVYRLALTAEAENKLSLSEKIDLLITKQEDTLTKIDSIHSELIKIKVRVSKKISYVWF